MNMKKTYCYEKDWDAVVKQAEIKLETLKLERQIAAIDDKLNLIKRQREANPYYGETQELA
jgi:hypothetical protein